MDLKTFKEDVKENYKLVAVYWIDACTTAGWEPHEDNVKQTEPYYGPSFVVSVGYIIDDRDTHVTVAGTVNEGSSSCDAISIPRCCINAIVELQEE